MADSKVSGFFFVFGKVPSIVEFNSTSRKEHSTGCHCEHLVEGTKDKQTTKKEKLTVNQAMVVVC